MHEAPDDEVEQDEGEQRHRSIVCFGFHLIFQNPYAPPSTTARKTRPTACSKVIGSSRKLGLGWEYALHILPGEVKVLSEIIFRRVSDFLILRLLAR